MNVKMLIEELQKHPEAAEVWIDSKETYVELREVGLYFPKGDTPPIVTLGD